MTVDFKQALFPDRDSPTRRTRERARESPDAWIRDQRVPGRQTTFSSARVFFSLQLSQEKRMTARSLWLQKKRKSCSKISPSTRTRLFFPLWPPVHTYPLKTQLLRSKRPYVWTGGQNEENKIARGRAKRTEKQQIWTVFQRTYFEKVQQRFSYY